ncbi:hypothetical protein [Chelativorans sp. YIM 93263]|uniref:hypothetical protein n=1 Tax=Chelativorans sp. YIM 93263 TaxID=2906648 RepID=UPI002377F1AE|nr:hypothetical protein [Chelativorans sp. YIM 93263]
MHKALTAIKEQLEKIIAVLETKIPNDEPFGIAHNNWSFPGLTRVELIEETQSIIDRIEEEGGDQVGDHEARLQDYVRRLQHLQSGTVVQLWTNANQAVPAYLFTLRGLEKALSPVLRQDDHEEARRRLKKLTVQLRGMEARLKDLSPRTASLAAMVERIEKAYNAADQLPTDLESLSEARQKIEDLLREATQDQGRIVDVRTDADNFDKELQRSLEEANAVLERCETAYSAATSVGLAAAFS